MAAGRLPSESVKALLCRHGQACAKVWHHWSAWESDLGEETVIFQSMTDEPMTAVMTWCTGRAIVHVEPGW